MSDDACQKPVAESRFVNVEMMESRLPSAAMPSDRRGLTFRLAAPGTALALGLVAAAAMMALPERWTGRAKMAAASILRPAHRVVLDGRQCVGRAIAWARSRLDAAAQLDEARGQCQRLREESLRLAAALEAERSRRVSSLPDPAVEATERLLTTRCIPARVLGQQARAFLQRQHLLDVGDREGVQPDALVIDGRLQWIDRGRDADLEAGQLALSAGRVWGKIAEVGAVTSLVRTVTEPGFRDLVRLATPGADGAPVRWGPEGILEGTGEPLARVRRVEATEPVALGDLVYTASGRGVLPRPLLYGRVVRLARPVGASHWDLWIEPAVRPGQPEQVLVLRTELNPRRVAARPGHPPE